VCYISEIQELQEFQTAKMTLKITQGDLVVVSFDRPHFLNIIEQNWNQFLSVVKAPFKTANIKILSAKFNAETLAIAHASQWPVKNITASLCA